MKKVVFGATVVIIALVLIVTAVYLVLQRDPNFTCNLVDSPPKTNNLGDIANEDFTALVDFDGYLKFTDKTNVLNVKFLPLQLDSIRILTADSELGSKSKNESDHQILEINAQCAVLRLKYHFEADKPTVYGLTILMDPPEPIDPRLVKCSATSPVIRSEPHKHFKCSDKLISYPCDPPERSDMWSIKLVTNNFEFQVHGDPNVLRHNKFSNEAQSCPY